MSPYGLPSAGYPASARWHVFAPAQLIHRLSRPFPKVSILLILKINVDSFAPAQLALRANLRLLYLAPAPALDCQKKEKESGLAPDYHYLTPEGAHFREILRCSLAQSNKYKLMRF